MPRMCKNRTKIRYWMGLALDKILKMWYNKHNLKKGK